MSSIQHYQKVKDRLALLDQGIDFLNDLKKQRLESKELIDYLLNEILVVRESVVAISYGECKHEIILGNKYSNDYSIPIEGTCLICKTKINLLRQSGFLGIPAYVSQSKFINFTHSQILCSDFLKEETLNNYETLLEIAYSTLNELINSDADLECTEIKEIIKSKLIEYEIGLNEVTKKKI